MSRELHKFSGGVHPPEHKAESNTRPTHPAPLPRTLVIPLRQHIGNPASRWSRSANGYSRDR
jgi:Na+-translocating ferredoxin:NAD+ oxidoreductase subunit C